MKSISRILWWSSLGGVAVSLALLVVRECGQAGDFHQASSLACSDCHTMHYSEAHTLAGPLPPAVPLKPGGPFLKLLRQPAAELCLACHDGRADAPDVLGVNSNAYVRAAGGLNRAGDGGEYSEANGHSLGSTSQPPGGVWTGSQAEGLQCKHCHDIHGNSFYRNLTSNPGTATGKFVTYLRGLTYTGTAALQQKVSTPMLSHYAVDNIVYRQTQVGTTDFGLSEWCSGCHGDYHGIGGSGNMGGSATGDPNAGSPWLRHPVRGVTMAQGVTNKHIDPGHWFDTASVKSRIPVVSPSGVVPGISAGSDNQVFCGSCHKAHGSNHRAGLIYDNDATVVPEDGTSLNQTCQQCHYE